MPSEVQRDGYEQRPRHMSRREVLSIGTAAGINLSLAELFRLRQAAGAAEGPAGFGSAKSVILIYLHGGHPQHETWDPKLEAPAEIRGEFGDIATSVPGLRISELLPLCARIADRLTIIRSLSHDNPNHVQASLPAMTGHKHPPQVRNLGDFPPAATDFPCFGAVVDHLRPEARQLPNWVRLGPLMTRNNGTVLHGQLPGFLGNKHGPFAVNQDLLAEQVRIEAVTPRMGVSQVKDRRRLLTEIEAQRRYLDQQVSAVRDSYYERAYDLLTSGATRAAFDLAAEPPEVRRRYGPTQVGQSCLLARRLVEAGVPFVNVHYCKKPAQSWDTHSNNFTRMKQSLAPTLDRVLSSLAEDLRQRGLLDRVLVVATAEFGRTPKINKNAGRDHWPWVYSIAMAGAALQRGAVYGASDRLAAYPASNPHDPADLAATIYHLLGIAPNTVLRDETDRPHRLIIGRPIAEIIS